MMVEMKKIFFTLTMFAFVPMSCARTTPTIQNVLPTATWIPSSTPTRTPTATVTPTSTPNDTPTATWTPFSTPVRTPIGTAKPTSCVIYDIKTWSEMGVAPDGSFSQIPAFDAPINGTAGVTNRMILGKAEIDFIKSLNDGSVKDWKWAAGLPRGNYFGSMDDGTSIDKRVWWNWVGAPSGRPDDRNTMCISAIMNGRAKVVAAPKSTSYEQYRHITWLVQRIWGNYREGTEKNYYNSGPVLYKTLLFDPDSGFVTTKSNKGFWIDAAWLHAKIGTVQIPWMVSFPWVVAATATPTATIAPTIMPTVIPPTLTPTPPMPITYDFVANACAAEWESNHGTLLCPGLDGDVRGFVLILSQAKLEDGTVANLLALLTFPEFSTDGFLQGIYPEYQVRAGDHLQVSASCENGAAACSVLFKISYVESPGAKNDLWVIGEFYDGMYSNVDLDLTALAGKRVKFVLSVSTFGSAVDDRALWIAPRIVHFAVSTSTVTSTATAISTSPVPATSTYTPVPTFTLSPSSTAAPPAGPGNPVSLPSITEIINQVISFFQRLLGH